MNDKTSPPTENLSDTTLRKAALRVELDNARTDKIFGNEPRHAAWENTHEDEDQEGWLITYSDLLTLLLALFVMLVSYANFQKDNFQRESQMQSSEAKGDSIIKLPHETVPGGSIVPLAGANQQSKVPNLAERIGVALEQSDLAGKISVSVEGRNLKLTIKENILFPRGGSNLAPESYSLLDSLSQMIKGSGFPVSIEGHTDNLPISTSRYPSNWELSAARASEVVRYMISRGIRPQRLSATGFADTQPIASNATAAGRAANRRVILVLHLEE